MALPEAEVLAPGLVTLMVSVMMAAVMVQVKLAEPLRPEPSVAVTVTV